MQQQRETSSSPAGQRELQQAEAAVMPGAPAPRLSQATTSRVSEEDSDDGGFWDEDRGAWSTEGCWAEAAQALDCFHFLSEPRRP